MILVYVLSLLKFYKPNVHNIAISDKIGFSTKNEFEKWFFSHALCFC